MPPICPYCGNKSERVTGRTLYPGRYELAMRLYFRCSPCDAIVSCYPGGEPRGSLANAELRAARIDTRNIFDQAWLSGKKTRSEAYAWLAARLGLAVPDCHIGQFDLETCKRAQEVCLNESMI
jgi:hypothetical protein